MRFDGNENSLLKKWELMDTGTHEIDYENILKWLFDCTVKLVVKNYIFLSQMFEIIFLLLKLLLVQLNKID